MATDRNLIAGAAALAQSQTAKSLGFSTGLVQEAARIQQDIVQKTNERRAVLRQDMNTAATFIGKMQSLDKVTGQYHDVLTERGIYTRDELNRIATDTTLNSAQKIAEYSKLTNEYNALASQFTNDQQKLIGLQNSVAQGLTSETLDLNDEDTAVARGLGKGGYEITKDGYNVTYDIGGKSKTMLVKSQDLDKYIGKYSIKNIEALSTLQDNYAKEIANAKGDKQLEGIIQERFELLTTDNKLKLLVDLKGNAYNNYIDTETNELNLDLINADFKKYAAGLTDQFGYTPTPEEKKDLFGQRLLTRGQSLINDMVNGEFKNFKGIDLGGNVERMVLETPATLAQLKEERGIPIDESVLGRVRVETPDGNSIKYNYYDYDNEFLQGILRKKLQQEAEGQKEMQQARNVSIALYDEYSKQANEMVQEQVNDINLKHKNNGYDSLTNEEKIFVSQRPSLFPDIETPKTPALTPKQQANTIKETRRLWLASDAGKNARKFAAQLSLYAGTNEKAGKVSFMKVRREMTLREWAKANPNYPAELYGQEEEFNNALEGVARPEPKKVNYKLRNFLNNDSKMDTFLNFMGDKLNSEQIDMFRNSGVLPASIELPEKYQFLIK
jgi:hypothetical protein